ncbi:hypothetical protein BD309DRAFT_683179 [Dichomitus squalens]|nr:hypothetical protein BD309DRAFT_683179 [Dichomitus squalens]
MLKVKHARSHCLWHFVIAVPHVFSSVSSSGLGYGASLGNSASPWVRRMSSERTVHAHRDGIVLGCWRSVRARRPMRTGAVSETNLTCPSWSN